MWRHATTRLNRANRQTVITCRQPHHHHHRAHHPSQPVIQHLWKRRKIGNWKVSEKIASQQRPFWPKHPELYFRGWPTASVCFPSREGKPDNGELLHKGVLCDVSHSNRWSLESGWTHESECTLQADLQQTEEVVEKGSALPKNKTKPASGIHVAKLSGGSEWTLYNLHYILLPLSVRRDPFVTDIISLRESMSRKKTSWHNFFVVVALFCFCSF